MNSQPPRISIVTVVYNRCQTISSAIESVLGQSCDSIEYIVIDGMSTDGTDAVVDRYSDRISKVIREPDEGIYDALNKGILAATGDVIGFVHADDMLNNSDVISKIHEMFIEQELDAVYGDLLYVDFNDPEKIVRYWRPGRFNRKRFRRGWMPPHPTVYLRKNIYEKFGMYRTDLGSASDYECMVRLMYKHRIRAGYLPEIISRMRTGGESNASLGNRINANRSDRRAWIENELNPPFGLRFTKPISKLAQYLLRPSY